MMTRASQDRIQTHTMRIHTFMTALTLLLGSSRVTAQEAPAPTPQTQGFQPFLGSPSPPFPFQGFAGLPGSPSASPRPLNPFFTGTFNGQPTGNPFLPPLVGPNQQFAFPVPAGFPGSAVPGPQFQGFPGSPLTGRPPPQGITNGFPGQFSHPGSFHIQPNLAGHSRFPAGSFPETSPISPLREVPTGFPAAVNEGQISGRGLEFGDEDFVSLSGGSPTTQAPISPVTPLSSPPTTPFVPETTPATSPPTSTAKPATTTTASTTSQPSTTPTTTTTTSTPPPTTSVTPPSTTTTTSTPPPTTSVTPPSTTTTTSTTPPPTTTTTTATTPPPTTTTNLPSTTTSPTTTSASTAPPADSVVSSTTASRPIAGHKSRTHTGSSLASRLQNFAQQASNDRGEGREKVLFSRPNRNQGQEPRRESEAQRQENTISASGGQSSQDVLSETQYDYDYDEATSDKQSQSAGSPTTSTTATPLPVPVSTEKTKKGRKGLTRTQAFLERLQKLRQRRLTSTTGRPRRREQEREDNNVQDNQVPPRRRTPQRQAGSNFNSRLRDRVFASRTQTGGRRNRISDDKNSSSGFRATRRPFVIGFTTKKPLTIRERLELHRQNNRFVPKHLRTTTKRTTTPTPPPSTTTSTTEIPGSAIDEDYDYITDYEPEAPALEVTERVPTTTTTQRVPITSFITTERTNSKVQSIRERIAAMLGASGLAGKTTTEEVLTILEEVTVKPLETADTATQSTITVTDNPVLMVHTDEDFEPTEMPLDEILSTIIETIATSELPPTTQALHSSQPSIAQTTPTPESLPFVSIFTSEPEVSTTSKLTAIDETEIPFPHTTSKVLTSTEPEIEETNSPSGIFPEFTDSTAAALADVQTEAPETVADPSKQPTTEDPLVQDLIAQLVAEGIITEVNSKAEVTVPEVDEEPLIEETLIEETGPKDLEVMNVEKNPAAEVPLETPLDMLNKSHMDTEISDQGIITDNQNDLHGSLTKSNESQKAMEENPTIIPTDEPVFKPTQDVNGESKVMTEPLFDPEDQAEVTEDNLQEPEKQIEVEHKQMPENVADNLTDFQNQTDVHKGQDQVEVVGETAQNPTETGEDTHRSGDQADMMASVIEEARGEAEVTEIPQELVIQNESDLIRTEVLAEPSKEPESPKEPIGDNDPIEGFKDQPIATGESAQGPEEQISVTEASTGSENQEEVTEIPEELTSGQLRTGDQALVADSMAVTNEQLILGKEHQTLIENTTEIPEDMVDTTTIMPEDTAEGEGKQTTLIEDFESTTEKQMPTTSQTRLTGSQTRTTPLIVTTESTLLTDVTDNPTTVLTTEEIIASELETDPFVTLSGDAEFVTLSEDAELTVDLLTSTAVPPSTTTDIPTTSRLPSPIKIPVLSNRTTTTTESPTTTERTPGFNPSSPRVSTVKMMDTTTRFQKITTTDLPPTTVPESQLEDYITTNDDALETPPPVQITEVPVLPETTSPEGDITPTEENEVDTTLSMNHLHMLLHSFGSTSIRPELAAMNRVLDFSLSSSDPVEQLGLNHEVIGVQNFDFDYDLEPASTEQVIVTTSLQTPTFAALGSDTQGVLSTEETTSTQGIMLTETNTPTILNMEVAVLTVSEPYSKVQNFTEAPETTQQPESISVTENSTMEDIPETTTEAVTDPMETTTLPPVTTTEKIEILEIKEPLITNNKSENTVKTLTNQLSTTEGKTTVEVTTPTTSPEEKESNAETNEELSGANASLSREDRERQRLAWLRKNSGKDGEQARTRQLQSTQRRTFVPLGNARSTSERPATGRRLSLSDLLSQRASPAGSITKTSNSQRENDIPTFTTTTTQPPRIRSQTVKVDLDPVVVKETQPQPITEQAPDPKNGAKSEALRRFLELNKQMLKALAEKKASTTTLPDEPTTTLSPEQSNTRPKFATRTPPRLDKFRALTESTVTSNDKEELSTTNFIPKNRATNPVVSTREDSTQGFQPRPSTFLRPVDSPKPSEASASDRTVPRVRPAFISPPPSTSSRSDPNPLPESRTDNTATRTRSRLPPPIRRPRPGLPGKRPGGPRRQNVSRPLTARPTRFENPSEKQNEEITTQAPLLSRESVSELAAEPENRPVQPPRRRFGSSTSVPRRNQFTTPRGRRKGFRKRVQNNRVSTPRRRKPTTLPRFTTEFEEVTTHVPTTTVPEFTTLPQEEDVTFSGFEQTTQDFFDTTLRSDLERTTFTPEEETTLQEFSTVTSRGRVRFENRPRPTQLPRITERPHHRSTLASKVAAFSNNEDATVQPVTRPLKPDTPEPPKPSSTFKPFEFETSATTISPTRFFTESPSAGGISTFTGFDFDLDTTPPTTFAEDFEESTQSSSGRFGNSQNFVHTTFSPFGDNQKQSINPKLHQTTSRSHTPRPSHNSDFDEAFFAEEDPPFINRKESETFLPAFPVTTPSNPFFEEIQETETFPPVFPTTTPDDFFHKEIKQTETFPPAFPITTPENPFFGEIKDADAFPPSLTITPPSNSFFVNDQDTTTFSPDFATTVKPNFEFNRKQEAQTTQPPFQTTIPPNTVTPRIIVVALPILNQAPASPSNSNQSPPQSPVSERVVSPVNQESSSPFPDVIPPQTDRPLGHVQVTSEAGFIPREVHRPSTLTGGVRITAEEGFIPRDVVLQPPPSPPQQPDQTHTTFTLQNDNGRSGILHESGNIEFVNDHDVSSQGSFSSSPSTTTQVPSRPVITVDSLLTFLGNDSNSNNEKVVPKRPSLSLIPTTNPPSPIGTTSFTPNFKLQSTRFFNQRNDTPSISPKFSVPTTISPPVKSLHPSPFLEGRPIIHDEFFNAPVSGFTPPTTLIPPENPSTRQSILLRPFESLTPPSAPFVPSTPSPGSPPPQNNFQQNRGSPLRPFLPPSPTTARPRTSTLAGILSTLINKNPTTTKQPTTKSPTTPPQPFTTQDPIIVSTDPPFSNQLGTGPPAPASIQPHFSNNDRITSSKPLKPFDGDRNHLSHQEPVIPTRAVEPNLPSRSDGQDFSRLPSPSSRPGPPSLESIPSQNAFDGRGDVRFSVRPSPDKDSPSEGSADAPPAPTPSHFPSSAAPGAAVERDPDNDHVPGLGGVDYPILEAIPKTSFKCTKEMRLSGRMFADPETACQVYHVCSGHQTFSFLCPRGTIFHQDTFVCQWWFTVDCQAQAQKLAQIQAQSGR
ncbi:mucin-2 isoform X1 [Penaeus vannamei]|uniref:mucin-2 isoform X1 n=1 Tax=Penaeus vannamei TaxID=6689 RepID=UPI00387F87DD